MTYPVFTNGTVLPASDLNAIGMWLVKSQTVGTGVSSVTVTGAFSADYDNYQIIYSGGSASGGHVMQIQLKVAGGSTSTTGYYSGMSGYTYAGAATGAGTANTSSFLYGGGGDSGWSEVNMYISDPFKTVFTKESNPVWFATYTGHNAAVHAVATSYADFVMTPTGGVTLTGGTISVYGYRK